MARHLAHQAALKAFFDGRPQASSTVRHVLPDQDLAHILARVGELAGPDRPVMAPSAIQIASSRLASHEVGHERTAKGLSNTLNDTARKAGLVDRTAHGLLTSRLSTCAEAGATAHQIGTRGGHELSRRSSTIHGPSIVAGPS